MVRPLNKIFPASPLQVFAVEATSIQLTWGHLPAGTVNISAGISEIVIDHPGGPGSVELAGLEPATAYQLTVGIPSPNVQKRFELAATTLAKPSGALLSRFATISDLHIGSRSFGALSTMTDIEPDGEPFAYRCAKAAIEDALAWGAELLVIKGDAVHAQSTEHMAELGRLVDEFDTLPMMLLPGNHDVDQRGDLDDLPASVGVRALPFVSDVAVQNLAGLRLVGANTTIVGQGVGSIKAVDPMILDEIDANVPCFIAIHQQLQEHKRNRYWPPGIPEAESTHFLNRLGEIRPDCFVSSGHTHRNRIRMHGSITISEVASTRDWPGVWGGYSVYEGGITQTVRKTSAPSALRWHEYSRQAVAGLWSLWSPGKLDDRCTSLHWQSAKPQL